MPEPLQERRRPLGVTIRTSGRARKSGAASDLAGPPYDAFPRRLLPWCFREHLQHTPSEKRFR